MTESDQTRHGQFLSDESGQATTEYSLVVWWTVIVILLFFVGARPILKLAVFDFYHELASLICLPIP